MISSPHITKFQVLTLHRGTQGTPHTKPMIHCSWERANDSSFKRANGSHAEVKEILRLIYKNTTVLDVTRKIYFTLTLMAWILPGGRPNHPVARHIWLLYNQLEMARQSNQASLCPMARAIPQKIKKQISRLQLFFYRSLVSWLWIITSRDKMICFLHNEILLNLCSPIAMVGNLQENVSEFRSTDLVFHFLIYMNVAPPSVIQWNQGSVNSIEFGLASNIHKLQ